MAAFRASERGQQAADDALRLAKQLVPRRAHDFPTDVPHAVLPELLVPQDVRQIPVRIVVLDLSVGLQCGPLSPEGDVEAALPPTRVADLQLRHARRQPEVTGDQTAETFGA